MLGADPMVSTPSGAPAEEPSLSGPDALVLIVDDHADTREMYVEFLNALGIRAAGAHSCAEALERSRAGIAALVIDRRLPDGDGKDVCRALKADSRTRSIPVIVLSGQERDDSIGADSYLVKPIVPEQLVRELQRLTAKRGSA